MQTNKCTFDMFEYLGEPSSKAINVFVQALICHDSHSRCNVVDKDVFDNLTLHELIVDLHMAFYFDACKMKKQQWLDIIGDVTYEEAYNCNENVYANLIGIHTHGHSSKKFWALLMASINDDAKLNIFISKSNPEAHICVTKMKEQLKMI